VSIEGLRILVVEDELLCAMELEELLEELHCEVIGPVSRVSDVLPACDAATLGGSAPDGALLDVNLHGERSYAAATELRARHIPVVLVTGYGVLPDCPLDLQRVPKVGKPFDRDQVKQAMLQAMNDEHAATRRAAGQRLPGKKGAAEGQ
jgi:CheY-like chemotaxis protein